MSLSFGVILGTSRPNRNGEVVAKWFMDQVKEVKDASFTLLDLQTINLPFLDEGMPAMMSQYQHTHTQEWSKTIQALDGFIVITPEYNHSFPAVLKNAFDFLNHEWRRKPISFVSYGGLAGGSRAVEQLRLVAVELHMAPTREQILIPSIWEALSDDQLKPDYIKGDTTLMINDLIWWAKALQAARNAT